jgi:hypothetical protein
MKQYTVERIGQALMRALREVYAEVEADRRLNGLMDDLVEASMAFEMDLDELGGTGVSNARKANDLEIIDRLAIEIDEAIAAQTVED